MKSKDFVASSKSPDRPVSAFLKFENTLQKFNIYLNVGINLKIFHIWINILSEGKVIPLQARCDPEGG